MSSAEQRRRRAIAYILRRRKRGAKTGANSGATLKSPNKRLRGHLVFKPSASASSWWQRLLWIFAISLIFVPAYLIGWRQGAFDIVDKGVHPITWILMAVISVLLAVICITAVLYIGLTLSRVIRSLVPHKNE